MHCVYGKHLQEEGKYEKALETFESASEYRPEDKEIITRRCVVGEPGWLALFPVTQHFVACRLSSIPSTQAPPQFSADQKATEKLGGGASSLTGTPVYLKWLLY